MNDWKQTMQLTLFESEEPHWSSLSCETQQSVRHVLAMLLLDVLEQHNALEQHPGTTSTTTNEDDNVS